MEPELDMPRTPAQTSSLITDNLRKLVKWLAPGGNTLKGPMRSVARELEEEFPAHDR